MRAAKKKARRKGDVLAKKKKKRTPRAFTLTFPFPFSPRFTFGRELGKGGFGMVRL